MALTNLGVEMIGGEMTSFLGFSHVIRNLLSKVKGRFLGKSLVKGLEILLKSLINLMIEPGVT